MRNEIETKRNEINENETKRNEINKNETKSTKWKRNKTKPTKAKRNQRKQNEIENILIEGLNPPLNLSKNKNIENADFRLELSRLRRIK